MKHYSVQQPALNPWLIGGLMISFVALMADFRRANPSGRTASPHESCQSEENAQAAVSREQLAQLLTVPERDNRDRIAQIVGAPYCQLQSLQVRAGVTAERQVYPLAFDPQTRIVILYEGNEYAGYRFSFQ